MSDLASLSVLRLRTMLRTAFGPDLARHFNDPAVFEIMVNPDGKVRIDVAGSGRRDTGAVLGSPDVERIIRLVASHVGFEAGIDNPIVSAELPSDDQGLNGERFEGLLPPVVSRPCFSIRRHAVHRITLDDYVEAGTMTKAQALALERAIWNRRNILVVGGTSSGKTTLVNALLAEVAQTDDRVILIEDTRELQCDAKDVVALRTRPGTVNMAQLVRSTLRLRPDRIIIGEVRGGEALDMLKAWNTGHPGGIATLHANSAKGALLRLEQLIQEVVVNVPRPMIADAIDVILFISGANAFTGTPRRVADLVEVLGLDQDGEYDLHSLVLSEEDQPIHSSINKRTFYDHHT